MIKVARPPNRDAMQCHDMVVVGVFSRIHHFGYSAVADCFLNFSRQAFLCPLKTGRVEPDQNPPAPCIAFDRFLGLLMYDSEAVVMPTQARAGTRFMGLFSSSPIEGPPQVS